MVLDVLGGVVVVFPTAAGAAARDLIVETGRIVREGLGGWAWDGVTLAVGVGPSASDSEMNEWEDVCTEAGLEFVSVQANVAAASQDARNEFGGVFCRLRVCMHACTLFALLASDGSPDFAY